ncbi:MAG: 2-hydroxyacyl-CoA dehydratase [Acetatifactor sp.]|nr:2-hydroxyacyl-CoA dehydratase [Acetatifactor sp.]
MSETIGVSFTRKMKKTHTILLPQMLEYHSPFLQAAFEANGYRFAVLQGGARLKERALRCINNDYCYPGILIVGQMLEALQEGRYPANRVAFMEPQAGGACRAGNYYQVIIRAMSRCGYGQVPVISLNYKGQEKHPGFRITPRLFLDAVRAVCYGDLILSLYHQVKPYEQEPGSTDRVKDELERELMEQLRARRGGARRKVYRHILEAFGEIAVHGAPKRKVAIAGEIYIKYCSLGNHGLEQYLDRQGCQCLMGGFINYAIYVLDSDYRAYQINTKRQVLKGGYELALKWLKKIQRELYREVEKFGRFEMDPPFEEMKRLAGELVGNDCITGDGWLVAAEAAAAVEKGCRNVLIVHPFGCLVSHVCERGILKRLKAKYPQVNFQTVEYDYDSSDALRESRIMLGLAQI